MLSRLLLAFFLMSNGNLLQNKQEKNLYIKYQLKRYISEKTINKMKLGILNYIPLSLNYVYRCNSNIFPIS